VIVEFLFWFIKSKEAINQFNHAGTRISEQEKWPWKVLIDTHKKLIKQTT
jgi:hypothetical protein